MKKKDLAFIRRTKSAKEKPKPVFTVQEALVNSYYDRIPARLKPYPKIFMLNRNGNIILEIGNNQPIRTADYIDLSGLPEQVTRSVINLLVKSKIPTTVKIGGVEDSEGKENPVIITEDVNLGNLFKTAVENSVLIVLNASIQDVDLTHSTTSFIVCPSSNNEELLKDINILSWRLAKSDIQVFSCPPRYYGAWLEIPDHKRANAVNTFLKTAKKVHYNPPQFENDGEQNDQQFD